MSKEINGYKLFYDEDTALYVAKSRKDVLDFHLDQFGCPLECSFAETHEDWMNQLEEWDLNSDFVNCDRNFFNEEDNNTERNSYYAYYKEQALKDETQAILWVCL